MDWTELPDISVNIVLESFPSVIGCR